jgi:agmatinase
VALLPFAGIATFARAPLASLGDDWTADAAVLGVPFDLAVGFRPGQRFAPRAVREASLRYALPPEGFYDLRTGRARLAGVALRDAGDVDLPSLEPELARERITEAARALRARARLPVFLGGDHSVSYPLLRAFDDVRGLHGRPARRAPRLHRRAQRHALQQLEPLPPRRRRAARPRGRDHARPARAALRPGGRRGGPRARAPPRADVGAGTPAELDAAVAALPEGAPVYLSIDVDALDPAVLPGTSSPEPDGLTYAALVALVRGAARRNTVVGADVVEFLPSADPSGNSALLVARLVMDVLAAALDP